MMLHVHMVAGCVLTKKRVLVVLWNAKKLETGINRIELNNKKAGIRICGAISGFWLLVIWW